MTSKRLVPPSARLALATVVATGMVAAPVALTTSFGLTANLAQAAVTPATTPTTTPNSSATAPATTAVSSVTTPAKAPAKIATRIETIPGWEAIPVASTPKHPETMAVWTGGKQFEVRRTFVEGYRPPGSQDLALVTQGTIGDMSDLSLNRVLSTRDLVPVNKFTLAAVNEQAKATNPLPDETMTKSKQDTMAGLAQPGSRHAAELSRYARAMTEGDLDVATTALAQSTDVPITEPFVLQMNRDLGVSSSLDAKKVAQVASEKQAIRFAEAAPVSY